jgi:hypothetical protein
VKSPLIRVSSLVRLRAATDAAPAPGPAAAPTTPTAASRLRGRAVGTAARLGQPVVARLRDQVLTAIRPEIDAAREEARRLRLELDETRTELGVEIELLRAELEGRPPADPPDQ